MNISNYVFCHHYSQPNLSSNLVDNSRVHIIDATTFAIMLQDCPYYSPPTNSMNLLCMCTLDIIIGFFKFSVSLLLNSLSFKQLLNHFHLKHFHQRHLCFFLSDYFFLLRYHFSNFYPCTVKFLFLKLFNFCSLNSLLLFLISILQFFF